MKNGTITMNDGRIVGFADYGSPCETAVVWCRRRRMGTFDVTQITCPVTVLHGAIDGLMPVANAHHTAAIVPGATLRIVENLGHVSSLAKAVEVTSELLMRATFTR
jgi:pimeloyl-ACP methyl ester carboxylesterase